MYDELMENLEKQLPKNDIFQMRNIHLAIFGEPYLTYMLEGKKTIESRFSKHKIAPYQQIYKDDIVIIKKSGGDVLGYFTIKDVLFFDLNTIPIEKIKSNYSKQLCVDDDFWKSKKDSHYATLIVIDQLVRLKPFHIHKKGMQTWVKLGKCW